MTREECEKAIMKKWREAIDILHSYAPECNCLWASYDSDCGDEWAWIHNPKNLECHFDYSTTREQTSDGAEIREEAES